MTAPEPKRRLSLREAIAGFGLIAVARLALLFKRHRRTK